MYTSTLNETRIENRIKKFAATQSEELSLRKKLAAAQVAASAGDKEAAKTVLLLKRALNFV